MIQRSSIVKTIDHNNCYNQKLINFIAIITAINFSSVNHKHQYLVFIFSGGNKTNNETSKLQVDNCVTPLMRRIKPRINIFILKLINSRIQIEIVFNTICHVKILIQQFKGNTTSELNNTPGYLCLVVETCVQCSKS